MSALLRRPAMVADVPGIDYLAGLEPGSAASVFWSVALAGGLLLAFVFAIVGLVARASRATWFNASLVALASPVVAVLLSSVIAGA